MESPIERPIQVEPSLIACSWHLQPFQASWPEGYLVFAVHMTQKGMTAVSEEGGVPGVAIMSDQAKHQALEAAMYRHAPLCEWLGPKVVLETYREADHPDATWARDGVCSLCKKEGRGTPFEVNRARPGARLPQMHTYPHVCFVCVANHRYHDPSHPKRPIHPMV